MRIDELRPGLYVQLATLRGSDLYQVCAVFPQTATLQRVFSRHRGEDGRMPARTDVAVYAAAELARMRPASARLVNQFEAALDEARTQVGA
jgi:hypothetical protein